MFMGEMTSALFADVKTLREYRANLTSTVQQLAIEVQG
jgi:hypothetical protein